MTNESLSNPNQFYPAGWGRQNLVLIFTVASSLGLMLLAFSEGLSQMVHMWGSEEYSHGYLIPLVSLFLLVQQLPTVLHSKPKGQWWSLAIVLLGAAMLLMGQLSTVFTVVQYGFLVAFAGLLVAAFGINGVRKLWAPVVYLAFMIPLPNFLYNNLSNQLQLVSSEIGVFIIRLFDISVYLEGNVIDLGGYQLQVVEACSGLRYLFPLMSFGFLIAYLYKGPLWQRALVFLSTVPITILMNSFRIAVIGVTVNYWGIAAAEGFLHDFEGWIVFMACVGILMLEVWLLHKLFRNKGHMLDQFDLSFPELSQLKPGRQVRPFTLFGPTSLILVALLVITPLALSMEKREELVPERSAFRFFPLIRGDWTGYEGRLEANVVDTLQVSDYIVVDYTHRHRALPVNLYVAYYESQRSGASIHSPRSCIPGGGWQITDLDSAEISGITASDGNYLNVNRVIIEKGEARSLVYYWFQQRGRVITNEYLAKAYLFWDALTLNRSDGALVRLVVNLPEGMAEADADAHLATFLREFHPLFNDYIPN